MPSDFNTNCFAPRTFLVDIWYLCPLPLASYPKIPFPLIFPVPHFLECRVWYQGDKPGHQQGTQKIWTLCLFNTQLNRKAIHAGTPELVESVKQFFVERITYWFDPEKMTQLHWLYVVCWFLHSCHYDSMLNMKTLNSWVSSPFWLSILIRNIAMSSSIHVF